MFGPFKRIAAAGTQTPDDMRQIVRSGELWGRAPAGRTEPAAQAYHGGLDDGAEGFEFYADVPPDSPWGPPHWREREDGSVWLEDDMAKVKILISRVTMSLV